MINPHETDNVPTVRDLQILGQMVTIGGDLQELREQIGLSRNAVAKLVPVSLAALRKWETGEQAIGTHSAVRIGEWYWGATRVLEDMESEGLKISDYIPLPTAAQYLSLSRVDVEEKCQKGKLECIGFGVLGTWVPRAQIPALNR